MPLKPQRAAVHPRSQRPTMRRVGRGKDLLVEVAGGATAPALARVAVREQLVRELAEPALYRLLLLVSEVVTNSVRHGGVDETGCVRVRAQIGDERIRVEVSDTGRQGQPHQRAPDLDKGGGFGLLLVDQLSERWGAEHDPDLRVWFEMAKN